jgi:uncharacterized phage protein gp47/JayE
MPYAIPTLVQLIEEAEQDVNSARITDDNGNVIDGFLQIGIVPVVAGTVLPGLAYGHYGYQDGIAKQSVPWTATGESFAGWAALKGESQKPATYTQGTVTWSGTGDASIPSGFGVTRSDGIQFVTTALAQIEDNAVTAPIKAVVAGSSGNFANGTTFLLANSIQNITAQSTGSAQTVIGADQETFEAFKTRVLAIYAAPPQGGDAQDYIEWAEEVPGVTRAWVNPSGMGAGTVVVYVMLDVAESANSGFPVGTNGVAGAETRDVPAAGDQLTVANALFPKQPVDALVYICAPNAFAVNFIFNGLAANNTTANQQAITAALTDMFLRLANVAGTQNPQTRAAWPSIQPSAWYEAVGAIVGLTSFTVGAPLAPIVAPTGSLPVLGTVAFNS